MADNRKRSRVKKPKGGTPPIQASGAAPGGSLEFPPPPQETGVPQPPMEPEISEPVDVRVSNTPFISADYPYTEGFPGEKEAARAREDREKMSADQNDRDRILTVQKIKTAMHEYLVRYVESETGINIIKRKIIPAFFEGKGLSDEEISGIAEKFDDQNFREKLIDEAFGKADGYFAQEKSRISQIWQDEKLTGSAIGTLIASLNGAVDNECRRILAEKNAEKAAAAAKDEKKKARDAKKKENDAFSPEQMETLDLIVDASKKAWKKELEKAKNWGDGFTPEDISQIIEGMTVGAIRGILKERKYSEDEIKKAIEYIMSQVKIT